MKSTKRYVALLCFALGVSVIVIGFFQTTDSSRMGFESSGVGIELLALIAAVLQKEVFLRKTVLVGILLLGLEASWNYLLFVRQARSAEQHLRERRRQQMTNNGTVNDIVICY